MNLVLGKFQWQKCLCYLDDIIVFGDTFELALGNLQSVFNSLRKANLKLKPKKCVLFQNHVKLLGHVVSDQGISCDEDKIQTVLDVSEVRGLLGLAGYYRRFIPNFSTVLFAMTRLTQKNRSFVWDESCQKSFKKLKQLLVSSPILVYPTLKGQFILDTDASLFGIGAVLSQVQNGEERVIAYASRALNRSQRRYCTTRREFTLCNNFCTTFSSFSLGNKISDQN